MEALCPKWWGKERAQLKGIAAIAQCQGTAERWPLVAGIKNRQINFWSPWESVTCQVWRGLLLGELSISQISARSDNVQKISFSLFPKQKLGKNYDTEKVVLIPNLITTQNALCLGCWLQTGKTLSFSGDYFQLASSACDSHLSKVFHSCPITTILQQLVCNLLG